MLLGRGGEGRGKCKNETLLWIYNSLLDSPVGSTLLVGCGSTVIVEVEDETLLVVEFEGETLLVVEVEDETLLVVEVEDETLLVVEVEDETLLVVEVEDETLLVVEDTLLVS